MLEGFSKGKSLTCISREYGCTPSTVTRAVKSFLTEDEFTRLKSNSNKTKNNSPNVEVADFTKHQKNTIIKTNSKQLVNPSVLEDDKSEENLFDINQTMTSPPLTSDYAETFTEIVPLEIKSFSEEQKEVACKPLDIDSLPTTVFMLITKNNELESKPLKDFSDWSFLPEKDQNRLVIPLFSTHRAAKTVCSRNQKVLKVPNSNVFLISLPNLRSKGITRLILDESLFALDLL